MPMAIFFCESLEYYSTHFDEKLNLVSVSPGLHTEPPSFVSSKNIHGFSESLIYAFQLLNDNKKINKYKALKIIDMVLSCQIREKSQMKYGSWTHYYEELYEKNAVMNHTSTGYIITLLQQISALHGDIISPELNLKIKKASSAACLYIVQYCLSEYLNDINNLMNSFALLITGQLYGIPEYASCGKQILHNVYAALSNCQILEYNSPGNDFESISVLELIIKYINDTELKNLADNLLDLLWEIIASHYHPTTGQIAGPHSRSFSEFLDTSMIDFIEFAIYGRQFTYIPEKEFYITAKLPQKYVVYFLTQNVSRTLQGLVHSGSSYPFFRYAMTATTYINEKYTIASFNREELMPSMKAVIGYFGTRRSPFCVSLTCIYNEVPFCSAALHSVQYNGLILGHISFTVNRGDIYTNFGYNNGVIRARELLIRLCITGDTQSLNILSADDTFVLSCSDVTVSFGSDYAKADNFDIHPRLTKKRNCLYYDIVIYSGPEKIIDFKQMESAIVQFSLRLSSSQKTVPPTINLEKDGFLLTETSFNDTQLTLKTPVKPGYFQAIFTWDRQCINKDSIEEYSVKNSNKTEYYHSLLTEKYPFIPFPSISDMEFNNIISEISKLTYADVPEMKNIIVKIFKILDAERLPLELMKRFSLYIVGNIFENINIKKTNIEFHSDILRKISSSPGSKRLHMRINEFIDALSTATDDYYTLTTKNTLDKVLNLIEINLLNPDLTLSFISESINISESYISRIFHKTMGVSFKRYLTKERMDYAKKHLLLGEKISDISDRIGYTSPNSFMRAFKNITGTTIGQYLKSEDRISM